MKRTELGKFLKKLRIDNDEVMKTMAKRLGTTEPYLSQIELGKRKIPKTFFTRISETYVLGPEQISELNRIINDSEIAITVKCEDCKYYNVTDTSNCICTMNMKRTTSNSFCKEFVKIKK